MIAEWTVASTVAPRTASKRLSLSRRRAGCGENGMGIADGEHDDMGNDQLWAMVASLTQSIVIGGSVM